MSESNSITLSYKQVIKSFDIIFSKDNRTITVGPLISFMDQMIPDGLQVNLTIFQNNQKTETIYKTSKNGLVTFLLKQGLYKNGIYNFKVQTAGITKNIQAKKLW